MSKRRAERAARSELKASEGRAPDENGRAKRAARSEAEPSEAEEPDAMLRAMADVGLTHVALPVRDLDASLAFYARYAGMEPVHRRRDASRVAWLSDGTRPFVLVLIETERVEHPLRPIAHLGVGCASREEVERRVAEARREGHGCRGPEDAPAPVGYWALIEDPDGHTLELSHGQEVGLTVRESGAAKEESP